MNNRGQARGSPRGGEFSMNRGRARGNPRGGRYIPRAACHPPHLHCPVPQAGSGTRGPFFNDYSGNKEFLYNSETQSPQQMLPSSCSDCKPSSASAYQKQWRPSGRKDAFFLAERPKEGHKSTESVGMNSNDLNCSVPLDSSTEGDVPSVSTLSDSGNLHMGVERMQIGGTPSERTGDSKTSQLSKSEANSGSFSNGPVNTSSDQKPEPSEHSTVLSTFDLCPPKSGSSVILKASLLVQNREKRNEIKRSKEQQKGSVLQSGMVLLKNYLSLSDQINIVKLCRVLGSGPGGFYQPGYRDGANLNLKMMCLGKNWDPETCKYGDHRPIDGSKPPRIPGELFQLVENTIKESHSLVSKDSEGTLPRMTPDICIVNFYSSTGRLGLHQDRDESEQSLHEGLPVVSFSIGDAAEFLYGEQRDVDRATKIILESGDVLIFGGKSRRVFHGVASIQPNTAPKPLLEKTNLRPGRLNLTFREY